MNDRRKRNIRTGLILALIALGFYLVVIVKHRYLGA
ncbi:MAG: cytochrome oxidase small assembly protein [Rhodocyclaceae bacterium]